MHQMDMDKLQTFISKAKQLKRAVTRYSKPITPKLPQSLEPPADLQDLFGKLNRLCATNLSDGCYPIFLSSTSVLVKVRAGTEVGINEY
ncbi:hypothetical protein NI389_00145 [Pseudoalteromonas xiamenensis]|uniref:hypothetical protein n=1 Tax=Pseudoalteromonas xiamenensis TaxID=882626 RepID=UPI0027E3FD9F|nr:hypothetical protein [Pseudoalteromonas xiamenensis]WMN59881.1 hypothetical protein NI389_00145 [Pseudoalteromonas xiamenensis]